MDCFELISLGKTIKESVYGAELGLVEFFFFFKQRLRKHFSLNKNAEGRRMICLEYSLLNSLLEWRV